MKSVIQFLMLCILFIGGASYGSTLAAVPQPQPKEKKECVEVHSQSHIAVITLEVEKAVTFDVPTCTIREVNPSQASVFKSVLLPHNFARSHTHYFRGENTHKHTDTFKRLELPYLGFDTSTDTSTPNTNSPNTSTDTYNICVGTNSPNASAIYVGSNSPDTLKSWALPDIYQKLLS
jgi:hypothetical protein